MGYIKYNFTIYFWFIKWTNNSRICTIVSKIVYLIKSPEKGDIVIAKTKKLNVEYIIKRVIGTPGDTIELKNNEFYVNGEKIDEPYIKEKMINTENQTWILGEDEYCIEYIGAYREGLIGPKK